MQAHLGSPKRLQGFTLVEIILVLVIMSIIVTMISNPSLLKQKDSVTVKQVSSNLLSFLDQRKLDTFLGKKIGDMIVSQATITLQPSNPESVLKLEYTLEPSRTQDVFDRLLPEDSNISYYFHHEDFVCEIESQSDLSLTLLCGYPERLSELIDIEIITCNKAKQQTPRTEPFEINLSESIIAFNNDPREVQMRIKTTYASSFSQIIYWDRRTGVMYDEYIPVREDLSCN